MEETPKERREGVGADGRGVDRVVLEGLDVHDRAFWGTAEGAVLRLLMAVAGDPNVSAQYEAGVRDALFALKDWRARS